MMHALCSIQPAICVAMTVFREVCWSRYHQYKMNMWLVL